MNLNPEVFAPNSSSGRLVLAFCGVQVEVLGR